MKKYSHLKPEQRYAIYIGLQKRESLRSIAASIGVGASTISREVRRNSTPSGRYVFDKAQRAADGRKARSAANRAVSDGLKTITTDNGSEFAAHEWLADELSTKIYFADAYCSWQKGNIENENENRLVRQYIPKGTDLSTVTDLRIRKIKEKINARPREKLNFSTPKQEFFKHFS